MTTKKRTRKHAKNSPLTSILVAVTGETSDETAVRFACELLDEQHSKLYILYIRASLGNVVHINLHDYILTLLVNYLMSHSTH